MLGGGFCGFSWNLKEAKKGVAIPFTDVAMPEILSISGTILTSVPVRVVHDFLRKMLAVDIADRAILISIIPSFFNFVNTKNKILYFLDIIPPS